MNKIYQATLGPKLSEGTFPLQSRGEKNDLFGFGVLLSFMKIGYSKRLTKRPGGAEEKQLRKNVNGPIARWLHA